MKKATRIWLWVTSSVFLLLLAAAIVLPYILGRNLPVDQHYAYYGMMDGFIAYPIIRIVGMVLFWGLVIYVIYRLVIHGNNIRGHYDDRMEILKTRLSKGEITVEEYEKIKATLYPDHQ